MRGPLPDRRTALALARHWTVIRIGAATPPGLQHWSISTREFREHLEWAVVVPDSAPPSAAVAELLRELAARNVRILNTGSDIW